jgi:hypothetical protein
MKIMENEEDLNSRVPKAHSGFGLEKKLTYLSLFIHIYTCKYVLESFSFKFIFLKLSMVAYRNSLQLI